MQPLRKCAIHVHMLGNRSTVCVASVHKHKHSGVLVSSISRHGLLLYNTQRPDKRIECVYSMLLFAFLSHRFFFANHFFHTPFFAMLEQTPHHTQTQCCLMVCYLVQQRALRRWRILQPIAVYRYLVMPQSFFALSTLFTISCYHFPHNLSVTESFFLLFVWIFRFGRCRVDAVNRIFRSMCLRTLVNSVFLYVCVPRMWMCRRTHKNACTYKHVSTQTQTLTRLNVYTPKRILT